MKKVSVIMPTYGKPTYLDKSINSVQRQTYSDWELIVVDDNDPGTEARKETENVMKKYISDTRIQYVKHPCNKNGSAARNTGISIAKGDFIAFLDSDDEYYPERLECCVEAITGYNNDKFAGVYTGCEITHDGKLTRRRTEIQSGNFIVDTLAASFPLSSGSNLFIRADVVRELNGFDDTFRRHQDYEFLVRYFRNYCLIALQRVLLVKNEIGTNRQNVEMFYKTKMKYLKKFKDDIEKLSTKNRNYIYAEHFLVLQAASFSQHQIKEFMKFTFKAFMLRPGYSIFRTSKLFARTLLGRNGKVNS